MTETTCRRCDTFKGQKLATGELVLRLMTDFNIQNDSVPVNKFSTRKEQLGDCRDLFAISVLFSSLYKIYNCPKCKKQLVMVPIAFVENSSLLEGCGAYRDWEKKRNVIKQLFSKNAVEVLALFPEPPGKKTAKAFDNAQCCLAGSRAYATVVAAAHNNKRSRTFYSEDKVTGVAGAVARQVPTDEVLRCRAVQVSEADGTVSKLFVSSGTLSMNIDGSSQVLAEELVKVEDIDEALARAELEAAQRAFGDGSELAKAEALIRLEFAEALLKAVSGAQ